MFNFDCFIVRDNCAVSVEALQAHPNIRRLVMLPRNWLLYEFHDDLFQDPDFMAEKIWQDKMQRHPELRQSVVDMHTRQRELLAPWYAKQKKPGDASAMAASERCIYRICTLGPAQWIDWSWGPWVQGWGSIEEFSIKVRTVDSGGPSASMSQFLQEWAMATGGRLRGPSIYRSEEGGFSFAVRSGDNSGHMLMALWAMLSDSRLKFGVKSVSLFLEESR